MSSFKPFAAVLALLLALLVACQPTGAEPGASDLTATPEMAQPTAETPAEGAGNAVTSAAIAQLATEQGIAESDILVLSAEETEFSDGCLGLGGPAESCLQALTPGWTIMLSANGREYEVRTDATGEQVRVAGNSAGASEMDAITASAAAVLADQLGLTPDEITVVSAEQTEFSDGCLGLGGPEEMCAQAITPGWLVMLNAGGQEYEAHTDLTGTNVRIADAGMGTDSTDAITASAAAVLADQLGLTPDEITVVSAEQAEFSDGCLGLGGPDEACLQAITPGWIVMLSAGGQEYEAHTDLSGTVVRLANIP